VIVAPVALKLVVDALKIVEVPVILSSPFTVREVAESRVVDALPVINALVMVAPTAEKLVVDALVIKPLVEKKLVAEKLVAERLDVDAVCRYAFVV
jgi:hypothetical protein